MKFKFLSQTLQKLENTPSRNEMTAILAELFSKTDPDELKKIVYLLSGALLPTYSGMVFNLADRTMIEVLSTAYSVPLEKVKTEYKKVGDLGTLAQKIGENNVGEELSVLQVYDLMWDVAKEGGEGSQDRRMQKMAGLLSKLDPLSARYVTRIPLGKLRLGFSDMTILDGLSTMLSGDKSGRKELEAAFNVTVDMGLIASKVRQHGLLGIKNVKPVAGTPIRPSLAERLPSAEKMIEKVGVPLVVEPKYDGFRAQLHINNGEINIYSRSLDNTTSMFPELVSGAADLARSRSIKSAIFDGEAISYDEKAGRFLPFQETIQRKRKHGIEDAAKSTPLILFAFDLLYLNGESYLDKPFSQRRKKLEEVLKDHIGSIRLTRQNVVNDAEQIRDLVQKYLGEGLEGAMVKMFDAPYKAGGRGFHWVKYKKTTEEGVADTIDCVVMGVYKGKGKRTGFGAGAFLVGVVDGNKIKSVSKIGTGLTDDQWRELDKRTQAIKTTDKPSEFEVDNTLAPDVWCMPELIVEILADEITVSPIHKAGLALRFPRLVKFRDDKKMIQATSIKELKKLFEMQKVVE